jgi:hypothetical protein
MEKKNFDYDELKSQLETIWNKTLVTLNKGKEEVIRLSKMGKIKLDMQMMERDKNSIFQKMGEETYKGLKTGTLNKNAFKKYVEKIEKIDTKIAESQEKLSELSKIRSEKPKSR